MQHMYLAALAIPIQGKSYFAVDFKFALKFNTNTKIFTDLHRLLEGLSLEPPATKDDQQ